MSVVKLGQLILTTLAVYHWVMFDIPVDPATVEIKSIGDQVYLEVPEITINATSPSQGVSEFDMGIYGFAITEARHILKDQHNICLDDEAEMTSVPIVFKRTVVEQPTYISTARAFEHIEASTDPYLGFPIPAKDVLRIDSGVAPSPLGWITGIESFVIPLPTVACPA